MVIYFTYLADYAGTHSYPVFFALAIAFVIISATFWGRVYYGVHTFVDVTGGLIISFFLAAFYFQLVAVVV